MSDYDGAGDSWHYHEDDDSGPVEGSGYAYDDEISTSRLALYHETGRMCGDCGAEFTEANGQPSCCETCRNMGSEYPLTQHPEKNKEAHKAVARRRRKNKQNRTGR